MRTATLALAFQFMPVAEEFMQVCSRVRSLHLTALHWQHRSERDSVLRDHAQLQIFSQPQVYLITIGSRQKFIQVDLIAATEA